MIIQKKYYMIVLLSMSSVFYGMELHSIELFVDLAARDPLDLYAARRALEIRKTTQQINHESRAAANTTSRSNGYYELVECRGPITVAAPAKKQAELPKPKL